MSFPQYPIFTSFDPVTVPISFLPHSNSISQLKFTGLAIGLFSIVAILRYAYLYLRFRRAQRVSGMGLEAPTFPCFLSRIETNILLLLWEKTMVYFMTTCGDTQTPVRLDVFPEPIYVVQGKHAIMSLWKQSAKSQALGLLNFPFRIWFQMPQRLVDKFAWDTSGCAKKPIPESNVKPQNRTERISQHVLKEVLSGRTFPYTCKLFAERLAQRLLNMELGYDWTAMPDLLDLFHENVTSPNIESLWGTDLTEKSSFVQDFWMFDRKLYHFSRQLPRWLAPITWSRRDQMLDSLRQWQKNGVGAGLKDDNLRWGSKVLRERMQDFLQIDGTTTDDLASIHLTFLWAANANIVPLGFWAVLDIFRRPELLSQLRSRLPQIFSLSEFRKTIPKEETRDRICADDLLLSIYTETLRLRVNTSIVRRFPHEEANLAGTKIVKDRLCIVSTYPAHMHGSEWNTGGGVYPLKDFWAYRFLVKPCSGESLGNSTSNPNSNSECNLDDVNSSSSLYSSWKFSMKGLDGSFIPYGGGTSICPGRHLAKHHFLIAVAAIVILFDIEIVSEEKMMQPNDFYYGVGVQHPNGKVPFRIKRRL